MGVEFDLDGIDELAADFAMSIATLGQDLHHCVVAAGDDAITAMQASHPYQDQTYRLSGGMKCKPFGRQTLRMAMAIVTFDAPYANIVNDGSVKTRAYPFIPRGILGAMISLERSVSYSLGKFCKTG